MHLANYLGYLHKAELDLADGYRRVGEAHAQEVDVYHLCNALFARQCDTHAEQLKPFVDRYGEQKPEEPEQLYHEFFDQTRSGSLGLLRDLYLMAHACDIAWTMIGQAAQGVGDRELLEVVNSCEKETANQIKWINTRMKIAAPQVLIVAS